MPQAGALLKQSLAVYMAALCVGHACVNVQHDFWKEPVIVWITSAITTFNSTIPCRQVCEQSLFFHRCQSPQQSLENSVQVTDFIPTCYYRLIFHALLSLKKLGRNQLLNPTQYHSCNIVVPSLLIILS